MTDLTDERLARLRVWAARFSPDHPEWREPDDRHNYDSSCPWCRSEGDYRPGRCDGNAHDLAVELIDEITRLRATIERAIDGVLDAIGMGPTYDTLRSGLDRHPQVDTRPKEG